MTSYVNAELRRLVSARASWLCEYCLIHDDDTALGCQVDHVIAEKHGGLTVAENLCYACAQCNRAKGSDLGSLSPQTGDLIRFFNPRSDHWSDHFILRGAVIDTLTEIGAVTARILGVNQVERVLEREVLKQAGRYPSSEALTMLDRNRPLS
jgi:hypothetical protein